MTNTASKTNKLLHGVDKDAFHTQVIFISARKQKRTIVKLFMQSFT